MDFMSNNIIYLKKRGVIKMNYEGIAELVHDIVKNPKNILSLKHTSLLELRTKEFKIIQNVFSKYEVSGDVVTLGTLPLGLWA